MISPRGLVVSTDLAWDGNMRCRVPPIGVSQGFLAELSEPSSVITLLGSDKSVVKVLEVHAAAALTRPTFGRRWYRCGTLR